MTGGMYPGGDSVYASEHPPFKDQGFGSYPASDNTRGFAQHYNIIPSKPHHGGKPKGGIIRFGDHIALKHNMTGRYLGSDKDRYRTGSKQQMVFAHKWSPKEKDWWIVMPALNSMTQPGETVEHGTVIRLKHVKTRANLHSHPGFTSPSTGQQEVTAFGSNDHESDENDEWRVLPHSSGGPWRVDELFTLTHVVTNHHLHSHDIKLKHDDDHNEITAFGGNDENDQWRIVF